MAEEKKTRVPIRAARLKAQRLRASALFAHFGALTFYMMSGGRFRFAPATKVAPRGVAHLTWDIVTVILQSHFGVMPVSAAALLHEVTGLVPMRGKMLVPWKGTKLEALTRTYKGAVGYLAALFSAIQPDGWHEGGTYWAAKLTTCKSGLPLETDGAGWYILYDREDASFLQKLAHRYCVQIRLLAPVQLALGKGLLYPCHWTHLPTPLKKKVKSLLKRRARGEEVELPVAIIDREQFKAGGRFRTTEKAQALGLAAEYAEFSDFAKAAIDAFIAKGNQDCLEFRANLGVMAVMRPDTMKLGPQVTLRVAKGAADLYVKILRQNWAKWVSREGGPLKAVYQSTIDNDDTGEAKRASLIGKALGFSEMEIYQIPTLAEQAKNRLLKKLYRFGCAMGMTALSAPLVIAHNIGLDKLGEGKIRVIVGPVSWFIRGLVKHGQFIGFGRYPAAAFDVSGVTIYIILDPRELPAEVLAEAPWLKYNEAIVGDLVAIMQDVTGDDDGDRGFVITEPLYVEALMEFPVTLGARLRFCIEGYDVDKSQAKAAARDYLTDLSQDKTGPVGVYTKCQDALLRMFAGFELVEHRDGSVTCTWMGTEVHPKAMEGVYWGMAAMSFMIQCAVDAKKNIIAVYRWWLLTKSTAWETVLDKTMGVLLTKPSKEFTTNEKVGQQDCHGFGRVYTEKGWYYRHRPDGEWQQPGPILREDGQLAVPAVFAWLRQMVETATPFVINNGSKETMMQRLLPWDSKDRKTPIHHFEDGYSVEEIHPLDVSYNVFLGLVREANFPKWLISNEKAHVQAATKSIIEKLEVKPVSYPMVGGKLGKKAKAKLKEIGFLDLISMVRKVSDHLANLGFGEATRDVAEFYKTQLAAAKEGAKAGVGSLTLEELVGLHEALYEAGMGAAAWQLLVLCENALTKAVGLPAEVQCTYVSDNADEFHKLVKEQQNFNLEENADGFFHVAQVLNGIEVVGVDGEEVELRENSETFAGKHPGGELSKCPHCNKWVHADLMHKHRARLDSKSEVLAYSQKLNELINIVVVRGTDKVVGRVLADKGSNYVVQILNDEFGEIGSRVECHEDWHAPNQEACKAELLAAGIREEFLLPVWERRIAEVRQAVKDGLIDQQVGHEIEERLRSTNFSPAKWRAIFTGAQKN